MKDSGTLPSLAQVTKYLRENGWKVGKSTVYNHSRAGRLRPQADGGFRIREVEKYADAFLKRADGTRPSEEIQRLQEEKLRSEAQKAAAHARYWDQKTKVEAGLYIERALVERELAARALVFKSDIENFIRGRAIKIVRLCHGDEEKAPDVIEYILVAFNVFLGRYSEKIEFTTPDASNDS